MGSLNFFSTLLQILWPMLSVATFVVCLQVQGRHKGTNGVSLLVAGAAMVMVMSLTSAFLRVMMINGGFGFDSISSFFTLTSVVNLVGQILFIVGLYQFGMNRRNEDAYDDLLDDLPD